MRKKLVICGYGWLAGYIADALKAHMDIVGTSRSDAKCQALSAQGIHSVKYALGEDTQGLCQHLDNATFIINIPPGRHNTNLDDFTTQMLSLIDDAVSARVAHIIFISTTSVYGDSKNETVNEQSEVQPETASAKAHVAIEQYLYGLPDGINVSRVRLAGLVGPDRHPTTSLSGRKLTKGNKQVNLVHVADVVSAITSIIDTQPSGSNDSKNTLFHLCSNQHPKRGEYYVSAAEALGVALPYFDDTEKAPCGKVIDASYSWKTLNVTPLYATPYDMY